MTIMTHVFDALPTLPADPILSLMLAFRADASPAKVDLTVGVYKDQRGRTPIMRAVALAERQIVEEHDSKAYTLPSGIPGFLEGLARLVFGDAGSDLGTRLASIQTAGGCAALRIGADLFRRVDSSTRLLLGEPTWSLHPGLLGSSGLALDRFDCYDTRSHAFATSSLLAALRRAPRGTPVLLQASCYNPTGADLAPDEWNDVLNVMGQRGLVPFFDLAYAGLGSSLDEDAEPIRAAIRLLPEVVVAVSCSKSFGLYRERTGALFVMAGSAQRRAAVQSQLEAIARTLYSLPPAHGALLVDRVLHDAVLRVIWEEELTQMRSRVRGLRASLVTEVQSIRDDLDMSWIARQRGMFSLLGLGADQIRTLRERDHVYLAADSRMNIAGLNEAAIGYVAAAIAPLLG